MRRLFDWVASLARVGNTALYFAVQAGGANTVQAFGRSSTLRSIRARGTPNRATALYFATRDGRGAAADALPEVPTTDLFGRGRHWLAGRRRPFRSARVGRPRPRCSSPHRASERGRCSAGSRGRSGWGCNRSVGGTRTSTNGSSRCRVPVGRPTMPDRPNGRVHEAWRGRHGFRPDVLRLRNRTWRGRQRRVAP